MPTPETRRQLLVAVQAIEDKKGEDTRILELDPVDSGLADFFLITSATNDRQVVAIADEIEYRLKQDFGLYATSVEGRRQAEWILLDYTDIVIHVFLAEKRAFYDIERLRKSARKLTSTEVEDDLRTALAEKTLAVRKATPKKAAAKKTAAKAASAPGEVPAKPAKRAAVKKAAKKSVVKKAAAKSAPSPADSDIEPTPSAAPLSKPKKAASKKAAK
jgi:ribosome-associated protein